MKITRIVATIGPTSESQSSIENLLKLGVDIIRLNGSHNTIEWHKTIIKRIKDLSPLIPILVDLPGRKIRTGNLEEDYKFSENDTLIFSAKAKSGDKNRIKIGYENFSADLAVGNIILADDGTLQFKVVKIDGDDVHVQSLCAGTLKSKKGINVPYVKVNTSILNERDVLLIDMCKDLDVDFLGISFVESAEHIKEVKRYLQNSDIRIVAKIENQYGIDNIESILQNTDALMIDRGDLGAETTAFKVSVLQKYILDRAATYGVPVIVATELMHSMIGSRVPTKAEISDVTNAVLDGASCVMLSGETAAGGYPYESVEAMRSVIQFSETYRSDCDSKSREVFKIESIPEAVAVAIAEISKLNLATKIVCITRTGYALKQLEKYGIHLPKIVVTDSESIARKSKLFSGVYSVVREKKLTPDDSDITVNTLEYLYGKGMVSAFDTVIVTAARYPNPKSGTKMNHLDIYNIEDLVELFNWNKQSNKK